nr:hypothetical protein [Tanacetum cinerariifolium]
GVKGGRGAFGDRGECSENMGKSSTTGMSQKGRGRVRGQRGRGSGERGRGRGEELGKQLAEPIVAVTPSAEPTASATYSTDKGKQVVEPQGKKK